MRINLTINEVETVIWALKCMADFNDNPDVIEKFKDSAKRYKKPRGPKADLSAMADKWPSDIVYRKDMNEFTGGVIDFKTMQNLDSQGVGPEGKIKIGKKIAYRIEPLIKWLEDRSEIL